MWLTIKNAIINMHGVIAFKLQFIAHQKYSIEINRNCIWIDIYFVELLLFCY